MAQQVVTQLVDDITGKDIPEGEGETIQFAFRGYTYEIDLDGKNSRKFSDAMSPYIDRARRTGKTTSAPLRRASASTKPAAASSKIDNNAVRAWAARNGYQVNKRGRIKGEIIDAYQAAQR